MTILKGWEISSDRLNMYEEMMSNFPIEAPIITSKCSFRGDKGFLIVSNNGFAWKMD